MTKEDQAKLIDNFMNSMHESFAEKIYDLPENWDGFEIRHWIAEKFDSENLLSKNRKPSSSNLRRRRRECENDIIVKNL